MIRVACKYSIEQEKHRSCVDACIHITFLIKIIMHIYIHLQLLVTLHQNSPVMTSSVFIIFWPVMKTMIVKMVVMSRIVVSKMNKAPK